MLIEISSLNVRRHKTADCTFLLRNTSSIVIRLVSDRETCYVQFSFCDLLYTKIEKRLKQNNNFCGHYYDNNDIPPFILLYANKPLPRRPIHYTDLNIHPYDDIRVEYQGLRGGGVQYTPNTFLTFSTNQEDDIEIVVPPRLTFRQVMILFGCHLFENGEPANRNGYITIVAVEGNIARPLHSIHYDNVIDWPWPVSYTFLYGVVPYGMQRQDTFSIGWPLDDYEFDSDDDVDDESNTYYLQSGAEAIVEQEYNFDQVSIMQRMLNIIRAQLAAGDSININLDDFTLDHNSQHTSDDWSSVDSDGSWASTTVSSLADLDIFDDSDAEELLDGNSDEDSETQIHNYREQSGRFQEQSGFLPRRTHNLVFKFLMNHYAFDRDYLLKLVEDILILIDGLYEGCSPEFHLKKIVRSIIIFLKLRNNTSILKVFEDSTILDYIAELLHSPTEESGVLDILDGAETLLKSVKNGKKLKVTKTLYRLGMFALSLSLFDSFGLTLDLLGYSAFDKELLRRKNTFSGDTILDLAEGLVFLLKKGYQIILTRSIDCIYHTEDEYSELYDAITDLKLKKVALNNPEALGFNEYWYGDKLDATINKLKSVIKYSANLDRAEVRYWRSELCNLQIIKNDILIAKNCSECREAPFSLLFFASPGVGKSTLTKLTFQHLSKTHDLPSEDKFMYVRNPNAEYVDGFKSEMHTYVIDDISLKHPNANPTGDVSLDEVYMLHGTLPAVTNQAALEDKGRIPIRIKFLLGTTNVKDLNAYHYFSVPSAFQRRFPFIVEVFVKREFQKDDGSGMLDAAKVACAEGEYPNYWELKIFKVVVPKNMSELAKMELVYTFTDINDFTSWLSTTSIAHFHNEKIMTSAFDSMKRIEICKTCYRSSSACVCMVEQSGSTQEMILRGITYYFALFVYFFFRSMSCILYDRTYWYVRESVEGFLERRGCSDITSFVRKKMFTRLSHLAQGKIGYPYAFASLATLMVTGYAIFKFQRTVAGTSFAEQSQLPTYAKTDARPPTPCGEEKELTWVASDKRLNPLDLTPEILSSNQHTREDVVQRFSRNVIRIMIYDEATPKERFINNAIVLKSNIILCNAHFFNNIKKDTFKMILVCDELGDGVNDRIEILYSKRQIFMNKLRDAAIFTVYSLVPRKDLTGYFASSEVYTRATGTLVARNFKTGSIESNLVHDIHFQSDYRDTWGTHPYEGPVTFGTSTILTVDGDCGSMLILHTPKGHFIASMHRAGNAAKGIIGVALYKEFIDDLLAHKHSLAVSAGAPKLAPNHTVLQSLHPKSVFNYIENGSAQVFGSTSEYKTNQKSRVCATPMRSYLLKHGYTIDYRAPLLKGYKPYFLAGKDLVEPIVSFNEEILTACSEAYLNDILRQVPLSEIQEKVHKYDLFTAVNGAQGVAFVDSINRSTSTGYPHCTSKRKFLKKLPPQRGLQEPVEFTQEFVEEIDRMVEEYLQERRNHVVYKATLKDEPVSFEKYLLGKTRLFGSAPISFVLVQRIYFLSIIRLMQTHKMAFECAVGVIAQTKEWELFYNRLKSCDCYFAGDFSKFDKKMPPVVILLAYWVMIELGRLSGNYTEDDITIMRGIATDTAYPFMLFNGDFVQLFGSNPSGHSLTVIINSIVNCIYLRYVFVILYMEFENHEGLSHRDIASQFQKYVTALVYGDDNNGSTNTHWFNFENIQRVFSEVGIKYTPPTKDDSSYTFMSMEEMDFLKRGYRYDKELDAVVAPLSLDSLNKMLTTWVASDSVSPEVQGLDVISAAIREYFFHGRETFEEKRLLFINLLKHLGWDHGINTTVLPTYEMLVERYHDASQKVLARLPANSFKLQSGYLPLMNDTLQTLKLEGDIFTYTNIMIFGFHIFDYVTTLILILIFGGIPREWRESNRPGKQPFVIPDDGSSIVIEPEPAVVDLPQDQRYSEQSGLVQNSSSSEDVSPEEVNVAFDDNVSGEAMDLPTSIASDKTNISANAQLAMFLKRPVEIYSYTWALGGTTNDSFQPWYLFMNHPSIKKKLDNYYLFKGNLKVKFVINATPFMYGAMMVSYVPLTQFSNPVIATTGLPNISYSQLPRVYLYPSCSQGASMLLPFVYHKQWLDLTVASDVQAMGTLYFRVLDALKCTSSATSPINIKVYAWLDDVQISAPTVKYSLQSGKTDEYGVGIISKPASALARAAGQLASAPIIGPYATATAIAAGAVSSIAQLFGFTNVPVIDDVHSFKPDPFPAIASTDIGTSISKLTLDSKNELSVDPRICGCDFGDELLISNLVTRESFLATFAWNISASADALLWNVGISPMKVGVTPAANQTILNGTPMWMVSRLFDYWKGDIEIRFKIICSQYHRGRLRFSWDPRGDIANTVDSTTEVYTKIVDIAESTDITIRIPYMAATEYLATDRTLDGRYADTALTKAVYENGILTVRVLTELSAPLDTANVNVLVFVRGCDNLEFACPREIDSSSTLSPFTVQSGMLMYDDDDEDISSIALKPSIASDEINLIYFGETIKSLRTLLRRTTFLRNATITGSTGGTLLLQIRGSEFNRYPMYPGYDPNGINTATGLISGTSKAYNWVNYVPITWLGQCFLANRGAIHWRVNPLNTQLNTESRLQRPGNTIALTAAGYNVSYGGSTTNNLSARLCSATNIAMTAGGAITNNRTLSGISASFPFYSPYKFRTSAPADAILGNTFDLSSADKCDFLEFLTPKTSLTANADWNSGCSYNFYVGAGTDFTFIFFLAVPTLYVYSAIPSAV